MEMMTAAAKLLLLLILVSYGQSESGCQLKENAEDMLSVDYGESPGSTDKGATTYVDEIEVKLKDDSKYVDLLKDEPECPASSKIITIAYRKESDSNWKVTEKANNMRISVRNKDPIVIPNINPCDAYEVNVTISNELVKVFQVEPFFSRTSNSRYGIRDDDHYEKVSKNQVNITSFKDSASITLDKICARKVVFKVFNEVKSFPDEEIVIEDLANASDQLLTKKINNLEPCTEYKVEMEFFLTSEATEADYHSEPILFTTKPDTKDLEKYTTYIDSEKTLMWNFEDFVTDECTVDEGETTYTLVVDNIEDEVSVKGSKVLNDSDSCEVNVHLLVEYKKESWVDSWEQTAFEKQITGVKTLQDSLEEDDGALVLTEDFCEKGKGELKVKWEPLGRMGPDEEEEDVAVNFPGLRQNPAVSDLPLPWTGCTDRILQVIREEEGEEGEGEGRIVANTTVQHPGWAKIRPSLELVFQTETEVTFMVPMVGCEGRGLKIEVECNIKESGSMDMSGKKEDFPILGEGVDQNGSMSSEITSGGPDDNYDDPEVGPTDTFTIGDPLTLDNLKPGTEYECWAKVVGKDIESLWSEIVQIHPIPTETETESNIDSGSELDEDPKPEPNEETKQEPNEEAKQNPAVEPEPEVTTGNSSSTITIVIVILVILMIVLIIMAVFFCRKKKEYTVEQMPEDPVKKEEEVGLKEVSKVSPMAPIDETPEIIIDPATPKPKEGKDAVNTSTPQAPKVEKGPEAGGDKTTTAEISSPPKTDTPPAVSPLSADTTDAGTTPKTDNVQAPKTDNAEISQAPKAEKQEVSSSAPPKSDSAATNSDPKGET